MTTRWNLALQKRAVLEPIRSEDVRRRSGNVKYWLLTPLAALLFYAALFWSAFVLLYPQRLVARIRSLR